MIYEVYTYPVRIFHDNDIKLDPDGYDLARHVLCIEGYAIGKFAVTTVLDVTTIRFHFRMFQYSDALVRASVGSRLVDEGPRALHSQQMTWTMTSVLSYGVTIGLRLFEPQNTQGLSGSAITRSARSESVGLVPRLDRARWFSYLHHGMIPLGVHSICPRVESQTLI